MREAVGADGAFEAEVLGRCGPDMGMFHLRLSGDPFELLEQHGEVQGQQAVGTGRGVLGDQKKLSTLIEGGVFIAFDSHRAPVIQTWDMHGNLIYYLLTRMSGFTPSYRASSPNNVWSDPAVVDAHVHVSWTYDYYFKRFKRSGLDGRDGDINIVVNPLTQQNWSVDTGYSNNAYWCTPCLQGKGLMLFGSGMPEGSEIGRAHV